MDKKNLILSAGALLSVVPAAGQYSPTPKFTGKIGKTVATTQTAYPERNPKAPQGAPNVVWILLDDVGFAGTSPFGGLIDTPTFEYLAQNGLRFNNFHTTSISAPTRAALLTGRNHHSVHTGMFNTDTYGAPGYDTYEPLESGNIAEILRENGYNTFAVGKYHATPDGNGTAAGPFNRWPTGRGFDHYFGYTPTAGCDDQWHPFIYRDTQREPDDSLGQLAITRFTNEAINFIADQKTADPDKPFFLYFAPGAAHWPLQTSREWLDKYKGKFDEGWDEYAKKILAKQIEQGIVPKGTKLPVRNADLDKWSSLNANEKKLFARQMELYAGVLSQADYEIGRIVDYLREINQLDNTVIILATGDNGSEASGRKTGVFGANPHRQNDRAYRDSLVNEELKILDLQGSEVTYTHYAEGWAAAIDTPFRYYKGYADYEGGTRNGLIVFAPKFIKEKGAIRTQYTHVIDVLPTTVELTQTKVPEVINGYKQNPVEGISFAYAIESPDNRVADRHTSQYFELGGSFAYYKDGWKIQFPNDSIFGYRQRGNHLDTTPHLYHVAVDINESKDLAKKYPEKVTELKAEFDKVAEKYHVYPLKPWGYQDKAALQHKALTQKKHYDIYLGARNYTEIADFSPTRGSGYVLTAEIEAQGEKTNGVLYSNAGGMTTNFSFYLKDGVPVFAYKPLFESQEPIKLVGSKAIPSGKVKVQAEVAKDNHSDNYTVTLLVNGEKVGSKSINLKYLSLGSLQIGRNWGPSVSPADYKSPGYLQGKFIKTYIDVK